MKLANVARVVNYCVQNPRGAYGRVKAAAVPPPAPAEVPGAPDGPGLASAANPLWDYFQDHHEGPGIHKWLHYFEMYHRHFARFVGRAPHVVEVGIFSGGSLGMWHRYFGPGCRVTGIDVAEECRVYADERTSIFIGDQADRTFWRDFRAQVPPVDILIDDGGHTPEQQRVTLEEMLPHLKPGGIYLCEDVHGASNEFAAHAHALLTQLHAPDLADMRPFEGQLLAGSSPFQDLVHSAHLYPFAILIERNDRPPAGFESRRRGSEWAPFPG